MWRSALLGPFETVASHTQRERLLGAGLGSGPPAARPFAPLAPGVPVESLSRLLGVSRSLAVQLRLSERQGHLDIGMASPRVPLPAEQRKSLSKERKIDPR